MEALGARLWLDSYLVHVASSSQEISDYVSLAVGLRKHATIPVVIRRLDD